MNVKLKFRRENGKAVLALDATELHNYLREIGVELNSEGTKFVGAPYSDYTDIDPRSHRITTSLLLRLNPQTVDLSTVYSNPVTLNQLTALAESAGDVVRAVIDHYRPIEISVVIAGKKVA